MEDTQSRTKEVDKKVSERQEEGEQCVQTSQDGNRRGPEPSGGEKLMHPEPLYKYHLRRGVDDGDRMSRRNRGKHIDV